METISARQPKIVTFVHTGDLGDCIAALPIMRTFGRANLIITEKKGASRETMRGRRFEAILPLLQEQPYIESVKWVNRPKKFDYDFSFFQKKPHSYGQCLTDWQADAVGLKKCGYTFDPWLHVGRSELATGRAVINRSTRYYNGSFPWERIMRVYGKDAIFVGHEDEHKTFEKEHGRIAFVPTPDLLDLTELIAGADIFIGNQSCPMWIAFGLGKKVIQETWPGGPNSCVPLPHCIYTRDYSEVQKLVELLGGPKVQKSCPQPVMVMG